ncbi:MAG: D-alanine--D-alanine ligase [Candidatus Colwellbacteria bacterium]|nr:D-alanine--D-alanine ligase [Candidatus Colwellbacteria bacterium]
MNIGVFFGSRSPEHDVSILTGELIIAGLKKLGHQVFPIYLDKQGRWLIDERLGSLEFFQKAGSKIEPRGLNDFILDLEKSLGKLAFKKKGFSKKEIAIDLAFPAFHGSYGEDGTIQGLFEIFNVPYVGCDVTSSAVTMDKILTKQIYEAAKFPTTKFVFFTKKEWERDKSQILKRIKGLKWPLFVKPARLGSSIGVAKVKTLKELEFAIEVALHYDTRALVEEAVLDLMDLTVAVLGNDDPIPSLIQDSSFEGDLFSYEEKYLKKGGAQLGRATKSINIPAAIDARTTKKIQDMAVQIFKLFGCSGIARVDFLYNKKTKAIYANEINTLPGTLYHHLWRQSGVSFNELLTRLIELAEEKHQSKKEIIYTFESDILKQAGASKLKLNF